MNEASLKGMLTQLLRQELLRFVLIRHEDKSSYGVPDLSLTGHGVTSWLEIKLADPDFKSHGSQELMMKRLGNVGTAFYIIYRVKVDRSRETIIVHPADFVDWKTAGERVEGFDHQFVVEFIRKVHGL